MSNNTPSSYIEATPSYVNVYELHNYLYDKYANYYNENFVDGQEKLLSTLSNLDMIKEIQKKQLKRGIENLRIKFDEEYSELAKEKKNFPKDYPVSSFKDFQEYKEELFLIIKESFRPKNPYFYCQYKKYADNTYENLIVILHYIDEALLNKYLSGACIDEILSIFHSYAKVTRIETNKRVLEKVINKILELEYPEKIKTLDEMTEAEKEKVHEELETPGRPSAIKSGEDFENFKEAASSIKIDPDGPVKNKTQYWEELSYLLKEDYKISIAPGTIRQNYQEYLPQEVKIELN